MVNLSTVTDTEIQGFLKDSLAALWEMMTSRWRDYYVSTQSYSLVADTEAYALPADFRAASAVFITNGTGAQKQRIALRPFNLNEFASRNYWSVNTLPIMYRIMGNQIYFTPIPSTAVSNAVELWYVPQWTPPATVSTTIDSVLPNGWELWVILDTCITIATRMRLLDWVQLFMPQRDKAEQRLILGASIRDETPQQMTDVYATPDGFWFE